LYVIAKYSPCRLLVNFPLFKPSRNTLRVPPTYNREILTPTEKSRRSKFKQTMTLLNDCRTSQIMAMVHDHTSRAGKMDMNTTVPTIHRPSDFSDKTQENKCVAYTISMAI